MKKAIQHVLLRLVCGSILFWAIPSLADVKTVAALRTELVSPWLVTVQGESRPRTLKIKWVEQRNEESFILNADYGYSDERQGPVKAEIIQKADELKLILTTQADSRIVAIQSSNGSFSGTFTTRVGVAKPITLERTTEADIRKNVPTRIEVSVPGDGVTIAGILFQPSEMFEKRPGIIVLHGWNESNVNGAAQVERTARDLSKQGYVTIAVSMRGWPKSEGNDDCGLKQPDDIAMVAEWLASHQDVNPDQIGIYGSSQGGQVALLTAARSKRIKAVVAIYPVTDTDRWQRTTSHDGIRDYYVPRVCGFGKSRSPLFVAESIKAPVLLIHGDRDTRVPTEQSVLMRDALQKASNAVRLEIIPDAVHGFNQAQKEVVWPLVTKFFETYLQTAK